MEAIHRKGTQTVQSDAIIEGTEKKGTDLKSLHVARCILSLYQFSNWLQGAMC